MMGILFHCIGANTFIIIRIMEPFYLLCGMVIAVPKIEGRKDFYDDQQQRQQELLPENP